VRAMYEPVKPVTIQTETLPLRRAIERPGFNYAILRSLDFHAGSAVAPLRPLPPGGGRVSPAPSAVPPGRPPTARACSTSPPGIAAQPSLKRTSLGVKIPLRVFQHLRRHALR
jgi:hypothetical protein